MCCGINVDIYNVKFELKYLLQKKVRKNIQIAKFQFDFSPPTSLMKNVNFTTFFHFIILCDDDNKA